VTAHDLAKLFDVRRALAGEHFAFVPRGSQLQQFELRSRDSETCSSALLVCAPAAAAGQDLDLRHRVMRSADRVTAETPCL
jgi:hypothetical protein